MTKGSQSQGCPFSRCGHGGELLARWRFCGRSQPQGPGASAKQMFLGKWSERKKRAKGGGVQCWGLARTKPDQASHPHLAHESAFSATLSTIPDASSSTGSRLREDSDQGESASCPDATSRREKPPSEGLLWDAGPSSPSLTPFPPSSPGLPSPHSHGRHSGAPQEAGPGSSHW